MDRNHPILVSRRRDAAIADALWLVVTGLVLCFGALLWSTVGHAEAIAIGPAEPPAAASDPLVALLHLVVELVKSGQWFQVGAVLTICAVLGLRKFGEWGLGQIPAGATGAPGALRGGLAFLFKTKPGGWLLNVATTAAGGLGTAALAGMHLTLALATPILFGAAATAGIYGGLKDLWEWYEVRKDVKLVAVAGETAALAIVPKIETASGAADELGK